MARKATAAKVTLTMPAETLEHIDEIAGSFEDFVSRGEVIEMAFDYVLEDPKRVDKAFGPEDKGEEETEEPDDREGD